MENSNQNSDNLLVNLKNTPFKNWPRRYQLMLLGFSATVLVSVFYNILPLMETHGSIDSKNSVFLWVGQIVYFLSLIPAIISLPGLSILIFIDSITRGGDCDYSISGVFLVDGVPNVAFYICFILLNIFLFYVLGAWMEKTENPRWWKSFLKVTIIYLVAFIMFTFVGFGGLSC